MKRHYPFWLRLLLTASLLLNLAGAGYAMDTEQAEKCAQHCQTLEMTADIQHDMQHNTNSSDCSNTTFCGHCSFCALTLPLTFHRHNSSLTLISHITPESTVTLTGVIPPLYEHPPRAAI